MERKTATVARRMVRPDPPRRAVSVGYAYPKQRRMDWQDAPSSLGPGVVSGLWTRQDIIGPTLSYGQRSPPPLTCIRRLLCAVPWHCRVMQAVPHRLHNHSRAQARGRRTNNPVLVHHRYLVLSAGKWPIAHRCEMGGFQGADNRVCLQDETGHGSTCSRRSQGGMGLVQTRALNGVQTGNTNR
jgi:hypothetical protein